MHMNCFVKYNSFEVEKSDSSNQSKKKSSKSSAKGNAADERAFVDPPRQVVATPQEVPEHIQNELRKHAYLHARSTIKAAHDHRTKCAAAIQLIFNPHIISREILGLVDQRLGEFDVEKHFIVGYGLPQEVVSETTAEDTGRRR